MSAPTLTADTSGNPWVEVFFDPDDLDEDAATITIYRLSEDREWKVRGGVNVAVGSAALDFEAPFGVTATYRAEQFDAAGASLGWTESASTTLDVEGTWIHNPLEPTLGVAVEVDQDSIADVSRPAPGGSFRPETGGVRTWIGTGAREGLAGAPVVLNVDGSANLAAVDTMLGAYAARQIAILCVRTSDPVLGWPGTFFAAGDWQWRDRTYQYGGDWAQLVGTVNEVRPPFPGLVVPLLTYDDLDAAFPGGYDVRDAFFSSYTEQDRAYEYAGTA